MTASRSHWGAIGELVSPLLADHGLAFLPRSDHAFLSHLCKSRPATGCKTCTPSHPPDLHLLFPFLSPIFSVAREKATKTIEKEKKDDPRAAEAKD